MKSTSDEAHEERQKRLLAALQEAFAHQPTEEELAKARERLANNPLETLDKSLVFFCKK